MDDDLQAPDGEGAKRLAGRALELDGDMTLVQPLRPEAAHEGRGKPRADRPVRVADDVGELHLLAALEDGQGVLEHLGVQGVGDGIAPLHPAASRLRARLDAHQQRVEVEIVHPPGGTAHLDETVGPAHDLVERGGAQPRQMLAHVLGQEGHEIDDLLRRAGELAPQSLVLGGHPDGAAVGVALADHEAADGKKRRGADAELLGAEQCRDDDVPARAQPAVDPQPHPLAQAVEGEHLMHLGQPDLPGDARELDGGERARTRAAGVAGDGDHVRMRLRNPGRHGADAGACDQLYAHARGGVDLLQVVDELGEILDGVDVVMRRRRDQGHPRRRVPEPRDQLGDLVARQLSALAGLCALGDLDLQLFRMIEVFGRHAEAARGDLLDGRVRVVAVGVGGKAPGILAALARDRLRTDPVHGDRQRLVRLG